MRIDKTLCTGCGACVPYCPVKAIDLSDGMASIHDDKRVECGSC